MCGESKIQEFFRQRPDGGCFFDGFSVKKKETIPAIYSAIQPDVLFVPAHNPEIPAVEIEI